MSKGSLRAVSDAYMEIPTETEIEYARDVTALLAKYAALSPLGNLSDEVRERLLNAEDSIRELCKRRGFILTNP